MNRLTVGLVLATALMIAFLIPSAVSADPPQITGAQIQDNSVTGADILESSLATVPTAAKLSGYQVEVFHNVPGDFNAANGWYNGTGAICPEGKYIVSGGAVPESPNLHPGLVQVGSWPMQSPTDAPPGWNASYRDIDPPAEGYTALFWVVLICAGG